MKITEKVLSLATGQETNTERDETPQEILDRQMFEAEALAKTALQAKAQAAKAAAQAKLAALGLTTDDLKALGL